MILNFMFNILILKQTPAFISYQYHPQVPPKASSAPRGPLAPHLGYGPSWVLLLLDETLNFFKSLIDIVIPRAQWELKICML